MAPIEQVNHLAFAKSYHKAYGYFRDNEDDDMESEIRKFQESYRLNVSGKLDHEMIKTMKQPRCEVTKFKFNEVTPGKTDTVIWLYSGNHGDLSPFNGPSGVWAHAFQPTHGRLNFDADERWSNIQPTTTDQVDLVTIGLHEAAHILGHQRCQNPNAVMFALIGRAK
ncbi:metalloendoproteinase 1-like [Neltuma alba]|uniref:metalloendoproteinase 1-like n=1 Tax=Neltuma alba TaxID=207710 RepID=UPI0010A4D491|nr:metalloendoproteinase 1-like [Prosopis alba]